MWSKILQIKFWEIRQSDSSWLLALKTPKAVIRQTWYSKIFKIVIIIILRGFRIGEQRPSIRLLYISFGLSDLNCDKDICVQNTWRLRIPLEQVHFLWPSYISKYSHFSSKCQRLKLISTSRKQRTYDS